MISAEAMGQIARSPWFAHAGNGVILILVIWTIQQLSEMRKEIGGLQRDLGIMSFKVDGAPLKEAYDRHERELSEIRRLAAERGVILPRMQADIIALQAEIKSLRPLSRK